jgi:hypothetical protein
MVDLKARLKKRGLRGTPKQCRFMLYYCDPASDCFMNKKASARAAKVRGGHALFRTLVGACYELINEKTDLKIFAAEAKLFELLQAKTTKFFQSEGVVITEKECEDNTTQLKAATTIMKVALEREANEKEGNGEGTVYLVDAAFPDDPSPLPGVEPLDVDAFRETAEQQEEPEQRPRREEPDW